MAWGAMPESKADREKRHAHQLSTKAEVPKPLIVFVTNDGNSRAYCHLLCEHPQLRFVEVRITHEASTDEIAFLAQNARLVVIATCRASLDLGSAVQEREKLAISVAQKHDVPVAILAGQNHEAVQEHLATVRGKKPLVVVPVNNGHFGEGFMDSFPIGTQFVERGDTEAHIDQIVRELLNRRR